MPWRLTPTTRCSSRVFGCWERAGWEAGPCDCCLARDADRVVTICLHAVASEAAGDLVGGRERCLLLGRAGTRPGALDFGDVPVLVEGHIAAVGQELVDLGAGALNARLHARD